MNAHQFSQQIKTLHERAIELYQRTNTPQWDQPELVAASLEELQVALEELRVAEEELICQNEALADARAEIEAQRQRYQQLFDFAPDGYLVTDGVGTIQEANRTAAHLLNISQHFLIGKPIVVFVAQEERQAFRDGLSRMSQLERVQEWEVRLQRRDGTDFDAALSVVKARDWQDKPFGLRWLLRDITDRKQAEVQIRNMQLQNVQLQEATRLKSQFLAVMSHELRTPMNAILGFSQLLLRGSQQLAPQQENMVTRIFNSGKQLLTLIDEVLSFSQIEAGVLELKPAELNLAELVTITVEELRSLADQKNLALQVKLTLQNPLVVNDSTRLRQVLVNLIANAIKFTECGGVWVEVWELGVDRIAIAVRDTGIGIAEADIESISEDFRQLNQNISRQHSGTGLGLGITQRLVGMMQGKVTVESQLGQGSTFRVELPRDIRDGRNQGQYTGERVTLDTYLKHNRLQRQEP